jgi:hypothetical protein
MIPAASSAATTAGRRRSPSPPRGRSFPAAATGRFGCGTREPDDPGRELARHDGVVAAAVDARGRLLVGAGAAVTLFDATANRS